MDIRDRVSGPGVFIGSCILTESQKGERLLFPFIQTSSPSPFFLLPLFPHKFISDSDEYFEGNSLLCLPNVGQTLTEELHKYRQKNQTDTDIIFMHKRQ